MGMLATAEEFCREIEARASPDDLREVIGAIGATLGFDYFALNDGSAAIKRGNPDGGN